MKGVLVYDVHHKRVSKVMRICRRYLIRVQNSVFEGNLTKSRLDKLKMELVKTIDFKYDKIYIYEFSSTKYVYREEIGCVLEESNFI